MPVCPFCDQQTVDPAARYCARCGSELRTRSTRWSGPAPDQGIAVAVALVALALAVLLAVVLSRGSGSGSRRLATASAATPTRAAGNHTSAAPIPIAVPAHLPALQPHQPAAGAHYDGGGFSLSYPSNWTVTKRNQQIANYAESELQSADAAAKVTVDHSPGEALDPAAKAAQVEAATSRTAGYRRLAFRSVTIGGRPAFEWVFTLAGATYPRRADIFVNTGRDGFAFLAYGPDFGRATAAARAIAASVTVRRA